MNKDTIQVRYCKKCRCELASTSRKKLCDNCRRERAANIRKGILAAGSAVGSVVIFIATKSKRGGGTKA